MRSIGAVVTDHGAFPNFLTNNNAFVDYAIWNCASLKTKAMLFAAATNNLSVQVLGSLDGGLTYANNAVIAAFDVTTSAENLQKFSDYYTNLKIQVQPKVGGSHGTLSCKYCGIST